MGLMGDSGPPGPPGKTLPSSSPPAPWWSLHPSPHPATLPCFLSSRSPRAPRLWEDGSPRPRGAAGHPRHPRPAWCHGAARQDGALQPGRVHGGLAHGAAPLPAQERQGPLRLRVPSCPRPPPVLLILFPRCAGAVPVPRGTGGGRRMLYSSAGIGRAGGSCPVKYTRAGAPTPPASATSLSPSLCPRDTLHSPGAPAQHSVLSPPQLGARCPPHLSDGERSWRDPSSDSKGSQPCLRSNPRQAHVDAPELTQVLPVMIWGNPRPAPGEIPALTWPYPCSQADPGHALGLISALPLGTSRTSS